MDLDVDMARYSTLKYLQRFGIEMPEGLQEDIGGIGIYQTACYFRNVFAF